MYTIHLVAKILFYVACYNQNADGLNQYHRAELLK